MSRSLSRVARLLVAVLATAVVSSGLGWGQETGQKHKIKVETLDDLPRHTYQIKGSVSELLESDSQFAEFAKAVRADIEGDLATYLIEDAATLQSLYGNLLALDMLEGRYEEALRRVEQIRSLEDKEASRLMTGQTTGALVAAFRQTGKGVDDAATRTAFQRYLTESVAELPWETVQDNIKQAKGRAEMFSETLLMGIVEGRLDRIVAQSGEVSSDLAGNIIRLRYVLELNLPIKEELIAVYQGVIDEHQVAKKNIWADRAVTLEKERKLKPVVIAIWDSGVDPTVFQECLFVNTREKVDGKDTDGNGFVDDIHGIAFDLSGNRTTDLLHPLGDAAGRMDEAMKHMKGFMDVQAAIESPEASALKRHLASLKRAEVNGFIEDLSLYAGYSHGTHVAGIATEDDPFARVLIARITFDYHMIPKPLTAEIARRHAHSYLDTARYFKQHDVRVVNMSWGWTLKEIESGLEANAVGQTAEERAGIAGEILAILSKGLRDAMKSAPEILFISSAGNEDSDVEFDEVIPSSFDLPNLLIVGAVDQAGEPTSFTSSGKNVVVYANGFEVESYVPGGKRMKMSGTSMSSPNVTNLAAKLIALKPRLKPTAVIELIRKGADRKEGAFPYLLMNPKRSVELLRETQ